MPTKIKAREIKVGSFLFPQNFAAVREVIAIRPEPDGRALWIGYTRIGLPDAGHCWDVGVCSLQRLAQWAERFCTDEEIAFYLAHKRPQDFEPAIAMFLAGRDA